MIIITHAKTLLRNYKNDDRGNIAMIFGVAFLTLLMAVGVGYDYSQLTHAYSKSQSIADQAALQAAIYVKNNGAPPANSEQGLVHNHTYTAGELGHHYNGFVKDGATGVSVKVEYDEAAQEARAYVEGKTLPAFLQVFNYEDLTFHATSVANYEDNAPQTPASVVMVMDNSGSMWFDDKPRDVNGNTPSDTKKRIDGLKSTVSRFMSQLDDIVGPQTTPGKRVLRTGLIAYNGDIIDDKTVDMKWGTLTQSEINVMSPYGSTNSHPPMNEAKTWINAEDTIHDNETGLESARFVIFMTDGQNTNGYYGWLNEAGTGEWRGYKCNNRHCWWVYKSSETKPPNNNQGQGWREGRIVYTNDYYTDQACNSMEEGVRIYTIGFALQSGYFNTNEWQHYNGGYSPFAVSPQLRGRANSLLASCATDGRYFFTADNTQELEDAFAKIGRDIETELIRIKS